MGLTSFMDSRAGYAGPVDGALQVWKFHVVTGANNGTYYDELVLPAGMKIYIVNVTAATIGANTSDPVVDIGTSADDDCVVDAGALPDNTSGALTIVTGGNLQGSDSAITRMRIAIINDSGDAFTDATVCVTYFVAQAPLSCRTRGTAPN